MFTLWQVSLNIYLFVKPGSYYCLGVSWPTSAHESGSTYSHISTPTERLCFLIVSLLSWALRVQPFIYEIDFVCKICFVPPSPMFRTAHMCIRASVYESCLFCMFMVSFYLFCGLIRAGESWRLFEMFWRSGHSQVTVRSQSGQRSGHSQVTCFASILRFLIKYLSFILLIGSNGFPLIFRLCAKNHDLTVTWLWPDCDLTVTWPWPDCFEPVYPSIWQGQLAWNSRQ